MIISAPDENKEQEKFLGYKWSNRKGQEGIQITKAGGCLYNASDRGDNNSIAGLIRNAFSAEDEFDVEELDTYYYRLRLQDMLDFSGTTFNKSIKTTPTRVLKDIPGLTNYRLSDKNYFDLSIGNRVLSDEVVENGSIPIYSANVFEEFGRIDKQNITDFSMPSILWGIDGDWMVNIIPANKPFYPTDHCGVLRIKTDDIIPKYMALALQVEGKFERFSRSNRASTQRISNLIIQVPSVVDQQRIVDEIEAIDKKIADEQAIIIEQSEKVKSKFVEMFGTNHVSSLKPYIEQIRGVSYEPKDLNYNLVDGYITLLRSNNIYNGDLILDEVQYVSEDKINQSQYLKKNDILMSFSSGSIKHVGKSALFKLTGKYTFGAFCTVIRAIGSLSPEYIATYMNLDECKSQIMELAKGININNLKNEHIDSIQIPIPSDFQQIVFCDYVHTCDKLKFEAQKFIEKSLRNKSLK